MLRKYQVHSKFYASIAIIFFLMFSSLMSLYLKIKSNYLFAYLFTLLEMMDVKPYLLLT